MDFRADLSGVDIFFVISGYVIAGSLLADLDGERFSLWRFYEKRVRRIFPALVVIFICSYVAGLLFLIPGHFVNYSRSLVASSTFSANIFFWKNEGYFDLSARLRPLLHTWSLAIEEQFYLFAPLMMWVVYRKFDRRWLMTVVVPLLLSFALSVYATRVASTANFFLLPTRAWELLIGVLLALRPPAPLARHWLNEVVAFAGLAAIAWAVTTFTDENSLSGRQRTVSLPGRSRDHLRRFEGEQIRGHDNSVFVAIRICRIDLLLAVSSALADTCIYTLCTAP